MIGKRWKTTFSLLLALGVALPARAVEVKAEPQAVVQGIQLHLDNLQTLADLPEPSPRQILKTEPANAITQLPVSYIQQAYIREAAAQSAPGEAAAGLIVEAVSNYPSLVGKVGEALQKSAPDDPATAQAVQSLWRWSAQMRADGHPDEPAAAERAWQRIAGLFDGRSPAPAFGGDGSRKHDSEFLPANDNPPARRVGNLLAFPSSVKPRRAQVDAWLKRRADPVEQALAGMDPVLASELFELIGAPSGYQAAAALWLRTGDDGDKTILADRPDLLQAFYKMRINHEGVLKERHVNLPELVKAYRGQGPRALKAVLDHTVEQGGDYIVQHDAGTWNLLSEQAREAAVERMGPENFSAKRTAKVYLELGPETDLSDVARRYALGRDPEALTRYLSFRRRLAPSGTARVPLENVMPGWIRKALESFEECTGANCVNAALGLYADRAHERRYVTGGEMLQTLGASFAKVQPESALEVGDILVYTDMNKQFLHMAAYVGGDYVFNKAGDSRYSPYVFQHKSVVEATYFKSDGLRLIVFRRKSPSDR